MDIRLFHSITRKVFQGPMPRDYDGQGLFQWKPLGVQCPISSCPSKEKVQLSLQPGENLGQRLQFLFHMKA